MLQRFFAVLLCLFATLSMAQEQPKPNITRSFNDDEIRGLTGICELATWASRVQAEPFCRALAQKMARTASDDKPAKPPK